MLEILGANYYIDVDMAIKICRPIFTSEEKESIKEIGDDSMPDAPLNGGEINIFKFEIIKACIERTLGEYESNDDDLPAFAEKGLSPSFKLAFNTLLKYNILKEENE
jgi:hypothetical protein